jgi:hypothetical protein
MAKTKNSVQSKNPHWVDREEEERELLKGKPAPKAKGNRAGETSKAPKPRPFFDEESEDFIAYQVARLVEMRREIWFGEITQVINDQQLELNDLSKTLREIRQRGYIYQKNLEEELHYLKGRFSTLRNRLQEQIQVLKIEADKIDQLIERMNATSETALTRFESKVDSLKMKLQKICDSLSDKVGVLHYQIHSLAAKLDLAEEMDLELEHSEALVEVAHVIWRNPENTAPLKGLLLLTDKRLIFNPPRAENGWYLAARHIERVQGVNANLAGGHSTLSITCAQEAPFNKLDLQIDGLEHEEEAGSLWQGMIEQVKDGKIALERCLPDS